MQTNEYSEETDDYRGIKAAGILMRAAFVMVSLFNSLHKGARVTEPLVHRKLPGIFLFHQHQLNQQPSKQHFRYTADIFGQKSA